MATTSVQHDNRVDALISGAGFANRASDFGKIRIARFDLEFSASVAGTTLSLCTVPANGVYICTLLAYEGTATATLDVGDAADVDRLVVAALLTNDNPTAAGLWTGIYTRLDSTAFGTSGPGGNQSSAISVGIGYKWTTDTVIIGTTGVATLTAGEVLRGGIVYSLE